MRNKPRIRFKGFTEDWEQRKLDDIAKIKTGGGTPKTANPEYWSGNIPWIQSSDLVEGDIVHVNINKFINNNALKNSAAKLISRDSIALVTRVGVGKVAVINQDFTTSQDFLSLSDFDGNDIKFLAYQLYRLMQENAKVLQGTSIKGITKTELIEQSISIPSSGQEQNLISNVLSKIDSFITFHQRKLEKLKLAKKALLQKLFPKNGSKFPELRFKGFADAWEQRKLGEFVKIVSGDAPSTFISGNCVYVKVDDLNHSDRIQLSSSNLVNANPKAHLVNQGATIFPKRGAAIMTNKVRIMGKDGYLDTNMMALIPEEIDKDFLFTFIQKTGLYKIADTSTIPQINNKHIEPYMIQVPSEKEQAYIGVVFKKIDKIITLHQQEPFLCENSVNDGVELC